MNRTLTISLLVTFLAVALFSACGKYDEGPMISFVNKKERISNIWKINYLEDNGPGEPGYPVTLEMFEQNEVILTIDKSGKSKLSMKGDRPEEVVYTGQWYFRDKNEKIEWQWQEEISGFVAVFNLSPVYRIRMLREDQLHLTSEDGRFRLHLSPL
jgi:hypothetical protein